MLALAYSCSTANIGALASVAAVVLAATQTAAAMAMAVAATAAGQQQQLQSSTAQVLASVLATVREHIHLTHKSEKLQRYAELLAELYIELLSGTPLRTAVLRAAAQLGLDLPRMATLRAADSAQGLPAAFEDLPVIASAFGLSCYVHDALPAVLFLAYKYPDSADVERALLANTNAGGNTVHRGAILGAILGAAHGTVAYPKHLMDDLHASQQLQVEIDSFLGAALHVDEHTSTGDSRSKREL